MKAMKSMIMKKRESGSSNGACKFAILQGRWCKYKKESDFKIKSIAKGLEGDKENSVIERGSIISLDGDKGYYLVFEIWRAATDKKFWPSAVKLQGFNGNNDILYMVQDGVNTGNIYRMLKDTSIQLICSLHGKVDV
eukprot:scaffold4826_cov274-Chaetoceros_neogracile.AAC.7